MHIKDNYLTDIDRLAYLKRRLARTKTSAHELTRMLQLFDLLSEHREPVRPKELDLSKLNPPMSFQTSVRILNLMVRKDLVTVTYLGKDLIAHYQLVTHKDLVILW